MKPAAAKASASGDSANRRSRLSFNEARELSALPLRIETLEARVDEINRRFADPSLYRDAPEEAKALPAEFAQAQLSADKRNLDVVGIFHTHPDHPPVPSSTDAAQPMLSGWCTALSAASASALPVSRCC